MLHSTSVTQFAQANEQHRRADGPHLSFDEHVHSTPWLDGRVPNGYWDIRENRIGYLCWLGHQYGFHVPTDWYAARKLHFEKNCGGGLLRNYYRSSVLRAMLDFFPNYEWKAWLFGGAPTGFWKDETNRRRYMTWLEVQLSIRVADDWYGITGADFFAHHGGGLLNNEFNGSVQALLLDYKPNYDWKAWKFSSVPQGFWNKLENRRAYLRWLGLQLGFETSEDWKSLRREHFYQHNGSGLFVGNYNGSPERAIRELFCDA